MLVARCSDFSGHFVRLCLLITLQKGGFIDSVREFRREIGEFLVFIVEFFFGFGLLVDLIRKRHCIHASDFGHHRHVEGVLLIESMLLYWLYLLLNFHGVFFSNLHLRHDEFLPLLDFDLLLSHYDLFLRRLLNLWWLLLLD